ncbi:MAG: 30S ribosomal protein S19e [Candidatus Woesearchaeota archaeon]|nr:MAG: 30S ribosomal protein S19e [Candidatus Woesearchaeota archaeon]
MATIRDVSISKLIEKAALALKDVKEIEPPSWAPYVKTGVSKERVPDNPEWWYYRTASVLAKVYRLGPIGVSKLRKKYGSKKNRGHKPGHFYKGSGNIVRKVLQQLEKAQFVKQAEKGVHKGRVITPKGKSFMDKLAKDVK